MLRKEIILKLLVILSLSFFSCKSKKELVEISSKHNSKDSITIEIDSNLAIYEEFRKIRTSNEEYRKQKADYLYHYMTVGQGKIIDSAAKTSAYLLKNYPDELYNYSDELQTLIIQYAGYYLRTDEGREGLGIYLDSMNKNSKTLVKDNKMYMVVIDQLIAIIER
jgi:hypothetical protein